MDLIVFRQASKERSDGRIIYKGEDTLPYVGENVFFVADGLGGASAIRHQNFVKEMFDVEKIFDVLFNGVFDERVDDELHSYVVRSFKEFLDISDCYFDNINNIKKSGYFGSRITSALFLYLANRFTRSFTAESTEWLADKKTTETKRADWLKSVGEYFTKNIKGMLNKVSENSNLVYESSFAGLALLGTTLCATIVYERKNCVDALYLVAGDSRPYVWDEESGLRQVSADQERSDGGMTNYIKANGDFDIHCEYRRFDMPCILFNASDGIFDSKHFKVSQLAFEKLLLDTIIDSESMDDLGIKLEKIFLEYGTHDDSSTIAMKTYGFRNFDNIKKAAQDRLRQIEKKYLRAMPDLLEHNYEAEFNGLEGEKKTQDKAICNELWEIHSVNDYYRKIVINNVEQNSEVACQISELDKEIGSGNICAEKIKQELVAYIGKTICIKEPMPENPSYLYESHKRTMTEEECHNLATELLTGKKAINELRIDEECTKTLQDLVDSFHCAERRIDDCYDKKESIIAEAAKKLWIAECESIDDILEYALKKSLISQDEYGDLRKKYPPYDDIRIREITEKAKLQNQLLSQYDKTYSELIQGA